MSPQPTGSNPQLTRPGPPVIDCTLAVRLAVLSTTYVEHIDLENDPSWLGTSFTATCRIDGSRWYHGITVPNDTTKGPYRRFMEEWRRVE